MADFLVPKDPDRVRLEVDASGHGHVWVNGQEIKGARRCELSCGIGELTVIKIEFSGIFEADATTIRLFRAEVATHG